MASHGPERVVRAPGAGHYRSYTLILNSTGFLPGLGTILLFALAGRVRRLSLEPFPQWF